MALGFPITLTRSVMRSFLYVHNWVKVLYVMDDNVDTIYDINSIAE